ncbi:MAG TPA: hypothetical protein VJV75_07700 [Candidatus Polarisedimenticolia bacterium]|nr:hypothetical protein [Candidatus Polarisedimenticolia bacterium]
MKHVVTLAVVGALCLAGAFGAAQAGDKIQRNFDLPATLTATIEASACSAAPGPTINLNGDLVLAGLNVEVMYRQTGPTSDVPIVVQQTVVPADQHHATPAQQITAGVSQNPYLWLQLIDEKGRALTSEIFLGRCEQGTFNIAPTFAIPASALAQATASECNAANGPSVVLNGATEVTPLNARIVFRSNVPGDVPNGQIQQSESAMVIQPEHLTFAFPIDPATGSGGGNPQVSVQFRMQNGNVIGPEVRLGRCGSLTPKQQP